jgi:hypothetical protein
MMIREFGGTISNTAEWETEIPTVAQVKQLYDDTGIKFSFVLNMITRDLTNQLAWLASLSSNGIPITHIEMGNEFPNKNEWLTVFGTKENYAATCATWIAAIEAIYPGCKFGIPGGNRTNYTSNWNQIMIQANPNAYLVHHYHNREQYAPGGIVDTALISNLIDAEVNTVFAGIPASRRWVTEFNLRVGKGGSTNEAVVFADDYQHGLAASFMMQKFYQMGCPIVLMHNVTGADGNGAIVATNTDTYLTPTGLAIKEFISSL